MSAAEVSVDVPSEQDPSGDARKKDASDGGAVKVARRRQKMSVRGGRRQRLKPLSDGGVRFNSVLTNGEQAKKTKRKMEPGQR